MDRGVSTLTRMGSTSSFMVEPSPTMVAGSVSCIVPRWPSMGKQLDSLSGIVFELRNAMTSVYYWLLSLTLTSYVTLSLSSIRLLPLFRAFVILNSLTNFLYLNYSSGLYTINVSCLYNTKSEEYDMIKIKPISYPFTPRLPALYT